MPGGPRGVNKADAEQSAKPKNYFSALMDDSSSDSEAPPASPVEPKEAEVPKATASPPFRVWTRDSGSAAGASGPFKSPFHRHAKRKQVKKEGEDGWVSLKTYEPPAANAEESEEKPVILYEPRSPPGPYGMTLTPPYVPADTAATEEPMEDLDLPPPPPQPSFPSLLRRKAQATDKSEKPVEQPKIVLEDSVSNPSELDQLSALAWAERVKQSLEAAERKPSGVSVGEEGLGRLSFFRRGLQTSTDSAQ